MASDPVTPSVEQNCIIRFLVKEKLQPAEIIHKLYAQYGEQTLSCASVYDWYNKFSDGCKKVSNLPHTLMFSQQLYVIHHIKDLILGNRNIASNSGVSAGSVETIIHEHLLFKEVCAQWGPKDVNVRPEGSACCCVCQTSALALTWREIHS
jgi:hypothetical protein